MQVVRQASGLQADSTALHGPNRELSHELDRGKGLARRPSHVGFEAEGEPPASGAWFRPPDGQRRWADSPDSFT
jgi:hypothetical protein